MKTIQVPIDEELLDRVSAGAKERGFKNRSDFIRQACRHFIRHIEERRLDEVYARGYRKVPERVTAGEAGLGVAEEILPEERWE